MVILISGSSHTGKTFLASKLMQRYSYPYLSIDHLKMGLIRSGNTTLTPDSDKSLLTSYLWKIVLEVIKTNIENKQNIIIEGIYIPFNYKDYFSEDYLHEIKMIYIIFSKKYLYNNFANIKRYANVIEKRINDEESLEEMIVDNECNQKMCEKFGIKYLLINTEEEFLNLEERVFAILK